MDYLRRPHESPSCIQQNKKDSTSRENMNKTKYMNKEIEEIELRWFRHFVKKEDIILNKENFNWISLKEKSKENQNRHGKMR